MKYMFAKHPKIAKRWVDEYGVEKNLPKKVSKNTRKRRSRRK
jgi:hypothetical protein